MPILSRSSGAAQTSVIYVTLGTLIDVWSGVWYWYLTRHPGGSDLSWYACWGFLLTGLALVVIGLALGRIGRAARHAELPPEEVTPAEVRSEQMAAARAPLLAPLNPNAGAVGAGAAVAIPQVTPTVPVPVVPPTRPASS